MKNRVYPDISHQAELDSLIAHSQYYKHAQEAKSRPTFEEEQQILYWMENIYSFVRTENFSWFSYENFLKVVANLDFSSSPGHGFSNEAPTIGQWLKYDGITCNAARLSELWSRVKYWYGVDEIDSLWKVFIKREPHKVNKMESKRWRLIQCCPLDIQVMWHLLFAKANEKEVQESLTIPSAQGIVIPYGGWRFHYNKWKSQELTFGSDKTAWDWTVSEWMIRLDLELRRRLIITDYDWYTQATKIYKNAFYNAKLILSDGRVYEQMYPGIVKSGCVNTISINSRCQVFLHLLYSFRKGISIEPMLVAVGDDTLQDEAHAEDVDLYQEFGVIIKSVSGNTEFLGREWNDDGPRPMYVSKHFFGLCYKHMDFIPEIIDALLREYVNDYEMFSFILALNRQLGFSGNVHSREYYKYWLDNPGARYE